MAKQMVINQNLKLKINKMKAFLIFVISISIILASYNYIFKPVEIDVLLSNDNFNNSSGFELKVIPKNELNFKVPFLLNKIEMEIKEGRNLIDVVRVSSDILKISPIDNQKNGKISIQLSIPERNIKKIFEFYISSQKA